MIGNDIIDLKLARAENKAANSRYLAKAFTSGEIRRIGLDADPELTLWTLWAMKETAYKAHQRRYNLPRRINPKSFECSLHDSVQRGCVKVNTDLYQVCIERSLDYIHVFTSETSPQQKKYYAVHEARSEFLSELSIDLGLDREEISIIKNHLGMPSICLGLNKEKIPFSMSHHGDFSSFVIALINC
ncbi:hypothetical protein GCM10023115_52290 [Pontixanthobacter gangjinensis]|uniref:4'-phosphopantetheinyl transferase superfamily protein n=1 Tax=Christiangramia aestuarii TaxID=1028746 RepID=A0A7K1LPT1_9FLAO|nr:4'-phosphopantetheinyl transferase superfamily protein [Christiangramia aestuarii]MUP42809.1 4'-phosphopantetheinyl transferase superfamily protein [Christiangramia aestuarii]